MDDKTELPKLKRSWIFTKIGVLLFATSIIVSFWWLADHEYREAQHHEEANNLFVLAWAIVCFSAWGVVGFISLIGFVIDCFRNRQKVVSVEKYKTNLIVWFCVRPIFFIIKFLFSLLVSTAFLGRNPPPPVDTLTHFGLSVLAAWLFVKCEIVRQAAATFGPCRQYGFVPFICVPGAGFS